MALLTDLLNLDLSDTTEKIIAEYIWYVPRPPPSPPAPLLCSSRFLLSFFGIFSRALAVASWRVSRGERRVGSFGGSVHLGSAADS
jgi:hypothetical protein